MSQGDLCGWFVLFLIILVPVLLVAAWVCEKLENRKLLRENPSAWEAKQRVGIEKERMEIERQRLEAEKEQAEKENRRRNVGLVAGIFRSLFK